LPRSISALFMRLLGGSPIWLVRLAPQMTKRPDWSRPLPQSLVIPDLMTSRTLADVRALLGHLPVGHREQENWRYVATKLDEAARGASVVELFSLLRTVLMMEGIAYRPK
jgi:hypothetical protein